MLVVDKLDSRLAIVKFVNYSYDTIFRRIRPTAEFRLNYLLFHVQL